MYPAIQPINLFSGTHFGVQHAAIWAKITQSFLGPPTDIAAQFAQVGSLIDYGD
jgi:hypothetical protein